jgi:hypothetical protein
MKKTLQIIAIALSIGIMYGNAQDTTHVKPNVPLSVAPLPSKHLPISFEVFGGAKYVTFQNFINKRFSDKSAFGFYNIATYNGYYTPIPINNIVVQSFLTLRIYKGLMGGIGNYMNTYAFYPVATLGYMHGAKTYSVTILPTISVSPFHNNQTLLMIFQFRPPLTDKVKLYSRFQTYNSFTGFDNRTYTYEQIRLGIEIGKCQFGGGVTFEQFQGEFNLQQPNVGLFVRKEIFN